MLESEELKAWVLYRIGLSQQRQTKWEAADHTFALVQQRYSNTEPSARAAAHAGARAFYVQVAAFANAASAENLVRELHEQGYLASRFFKAEKGLHVVMVGPMKKYEDAIAWKNKLMSRFHDAVVVP